VEIRGEGEGHFPPMQIISGLTGS